MTVVPEFPEGQMEGIARVLGECGSGTDITRVLDHLGIEDDSGETTKWRRVYVIFLTLQREYRSDHKKVEFNRAYFTPTRFVKRSYEFERLRQELNI